MKILTTILETKNCIQNLKKEGKTIGFVPTMGALHKGHASLLERAKKENSISISSIFVNPLQFNDKKDLEKYPKTLAEDIEILKRVHCDILFTPSTDEMYGNHSEQRNLKTEFSIDLGDLDKVMEGKHRPGHFQGVSVVVKKFFDIIEPNKAYFGEKDFQQLAIIKYMVKSLSIPIEIVGCPTVREINGLAMSSRNMLLSPKERNNASYIFKTLSEAKEKRKDTSVTELQKWVVEKINQNPFLHIEYFEIVNSETLLPVSSWEEAESIRACIAVKASIVRLIDNIQM